jgi:hypothetical protein
MNPIASAAVAAIVEPTPDHPPDRTHVWIWDVERCVWQMGPLGSPDCICGAGPCKGCAYGRAKKDGPMWWENP